MRDALRVGNIALSDQFFSVMMSEADALKAVRDELTRFAIVVEPAKTLFGKIRRTYTGKLGGLQDDLAICMCAHSPTRLLTRLRMHHPPPTAHHSRHRQLAITGLRCFYQTAKYNSFREEW
jgi:hypothetical protein